MLALELASSLMGKLEVHLTVVRLRLLNHRVNYIKLPFLSHKLKMADIKVELCFYSFQIAMSQVMVIYGF